MDEEKDKKEEVVPTQEKTTAPPPVKEYENGKHILRTRLGYDEIQDSANFGVSSPVADVDTHAAQSAANRNRRMVADQNEQPQEETPATETTAPEEKEPQMSDYRWNQEVFNQLLQQPITPEEEERRKRAASAVMGIGHLGNAISALSNVAFAGKAPSQTIPKLEDPDYQTFSDRLRQQRSAYASGMLGARNADHNNYRAALQLYKQGKQAEANRLLQRQKMAYDQAKDDRDFKYKANKDAAELGIKQAQLEENRRNHRASEAIAWTNAQTNKEYKANGGKSGGDRALTLYGDNGRKFELDAKDYKGVIGHMYKRMLEEANQPGKNISIQDLNWQFGEGGDQASKQLSIVAANIKNFPELYDEFDKLLGESKKSEEADSKHVQWKDKGVPLVPNGTSTDEYTGPYSRNEEKSKEEEKRKGKTTNMTNLKR